ncbi:MAG TPA: stage II sporulation protein M, partial [Rudaea sp.]
MRQDDFQHRHEPEWNEFERWLDARATPSAKLRARDGDDVFADREFPARYRRLCQQLALAERRAYSVVLVARLQELARRGHTILYRPPPPRWRRVVDFFAAGFPRLVRSQWRAMTVAAALFFVPLIGTIVLVQLRPEFVHSLFDPAQLASFENMYDPASKAQRIGRESGTDLKMFGFYIMNNVSIGFRTFASGLFAGVGAVFMMLMNGVLIGCVAGHL